MRLVSLAVTRLPGVTEPYRVEGLSEGVTVVVGPNASGKSSLMRALTALWNPKLHGADLVEIRGEFTQRLEGGEVSWRAHRVGKKVVWERDGAKTSPPSPPPAHLLNSYLVSIETLMQSDDTDAAIADALRREMSGGFDLQQARKSVALPTAGNRVDAGKLKSAQQEVRELERAHAALFSQFERRGDLQERWAAAAAQANEAPLYDRGLELAQNLERLSDVRSRLLSMPRVLERLSGDEANKLAELDERRAQSQEAATSAARSIERWRATLAETGLAGPQALGAPPPNAAPTEANTAGAQVDWAAAERLDRAARALGEASERARELDLQVAQLNGELREAWRRLGGVVPGASKDRTGEVARPPGTEARSETATADAGDPPKAPTRAAFDAANLEAAESALGERLSASALMESERSEIARLEAELEELTSHAAAHAHLTTSQLRQAQAQLGNWLAAEPPAQRERVQTGPTLLLLLAAALVLAAVVAGVNAASFGALFQRVAQTGPAVAVLASIGLAALVVGAVWFLLAVLAGRGPSAAEVQAAAQLELARKAYGRTGAAEPYGWTHSVVAQRLQELISEESRRDVVEARLSVAKEALRTARQRLSQASTHLGTADRKLRQLAESTGYQVPPGTASHAGFTAWLRDAREADAILGRLQGLHAARQKLEERGHALYQELVEGLAGTPFAVTAVVEGVAGWRDGRWRASKLGEAEDLRSRAEALKKAVGERDRALAEVKASERELQDAKAVLAAAEQAREALLGRCELDPASLEDVAARAHALVAQLPSYRQARTAETELDAVVRTAELALADAPHILEAARAGRRAVLEESKRGAELAAEERDRLGRELGDLDRQVKDAEDGRALERARSRLELARQSVTDRVRRAQLNVAAEVIFEDVESEHRSRQEPEVLRRARGWLERFTHGAYSLEFDPARAPEERLAARDKAHGRRLRPSELSTGTRAQLLLALRVAYATCAEAGYTRFPFFLDEALTTADPRRFEEIATSLLELARQDGRQIFYLSARREDAQTWKRVAAGLPGGHEPPIQVIDLAEVRRLGGAPAAT